MSGKCERVLTLPIRNQEPEQNARIVDILKHQRTEFMMCLEFDISDPTFEHNMAPLDEPQPHLTELTEVTQ